MTEIFCVEKSTFDFSAIDNGKIILVTMPQKFQTERRYVNTFLKLLYYIEGFSFLFIQLSQINFPSFTQDRHRGDANLSFTGADVRKRLAGFPTHQSAQSLDFVAGRGA